VRIRWQIMRFNCIF